MTQTRDNGGPAFPIVQEGAYSPEVDGMSLRDWFAGQALAGLVGGYMGNPNMSGLSPAMLADEAYQYADAMIFARGSDQ